MPAKKPAAIITPLWIIAALLGLCETVAGLAATQVTTGGTHITLVVFVVTFPLMIASAFFAILWFKPFVLYPPSEYGGDPKAYVDAMRGLQPAVQRQIELVEKIEESPADPSAQFAVISSLIDNGLKQHLILMHETGKRLPLTDIFDPDSPYETGNSHSWMTQGGFSGRGFCEKLKGTGLVEIELDSMISLTPLGHEFSRWLIESGEKAEFYKGAFGSWGEMPANRLATFGQGLRFPFGSAIKGAPQQPATLSSNPEPPTTSHSSQES